MFSTVTESDPLHDVHDHPAEADLQGAEVRVDGEDLHDLEVAGDHARAEQPLRDQIGVIRVPLLPAEVTFGPTFVILCEVTSSCTGPSQQPARWRPCSRR